jgi:hypothetical protein
MIAHDGRVQVFSSSCLTTSNGTSFVHFTSFIILSGRKCDRILIWIVNLSIDHFISAYIFWVLSSVHRSKLSAHKPVYENCSICLRRILVLIEKLASSPLFWSKNNNSCQNMDHCIQRVKLIEKQNKRMRKKATFYLESQILMRKAWMIVLYVDRMKRKNRQYSIVIILFHNLFHCWRSIAISVLMRRRFTLVTLAMALFLFVARRNKNEKSDSYEIYKTRLHSL